MRNVSRYPIHLLPCSASAMEFHQSTFNQTDQGVEDIKPILLILCYSSSVCSVILKDILHVHSVHVYIWNTAKVNQTLLCEILLENLWSIKFLRKLSSSQKSSPVNIMISDVKAF